MMFVGISLLVMGYVCFFILCLASLGYVCFLTIYLPLLAFGDWVERSRATYLSIVVISAILAGALMLYLSK